jgi:ABC-type glycerol-3-phosphate transport system substrate-binding protein
MKLDFKRDAHIAAYLLVAFVLIVVIILATRQKTLVIAIPRSIEGEALKEIAADFSKHQNVSVKIFEFPYDQLYDTEIVETDPKTSSRYDVILADDPWFPALEEGLEPLDVTQKQKNELKLHGVDLLDGDFVKTCLRVCRLKNSGNDGPIYGALPFVGNSQLFLYRKGANGPPKSWKDVIEAGTNLTEKESRLGYVMRVGAGNSIVTDFMPLLWSEWRAAKNYSPDAMQSATIHAFEDLRSLGNVGKANLSIVSADDFDLAIHLLQGTASTSIIWSAWAMAFSSDYLRKAPTDDPRRLLYITELPGSEPALGTWLLAIPKTSRLKDDARKFLFFATDSEHMRMAARKGNPPARRSILRDRVMQKRFPTFQCQLQSLEKARPRLRTKNWREIELQLGSLLPRIYANELDPENAWKEGHTIMQPLVEEQQNLKPETRGDDVCDVPLISQY